MSWMSHEECSARLDRRSKLLALIEETYPEKKGALLLCSSFEKDRESFYQDSSFDYIVGLQEPGVVFYKTPDKDAFLYEPAYSIDRSVWSSIMYDQHHLQELDITQTKELGDVVLGYSISPFSKKDVYNNLADDIKKFINTDGYIFTLMKDVQFEIRATIEKLYLLVPELKERIIDISPLVAQLRRKKEQKELEFLYRAVEITAIAQEAAAGAIRSGNRESDVHAAIDYIFAEAGSTKSFPNVVGGGKNSTILHYTGNQGVFAKGDLVLVDIGASFNHYCGDITRTYPVSGKFTDRQKEVYEIVLEVQQQCAALAKPGLWLNNKEKPDQSLNHIARKYIEEKGYGDYFPHGIGHYVGLDAHDVGDYSKPLAEGDIITIEPGIYIQEEKLGVRIEDMYWIVDGEAVCLSEGIPRTVKEIEDLLVFTRTKEKE